MAQEGRVSLALDPALPRVEMSEERQWYCVRTQTKRERIASENLRLLEGVEVLSPRIKYKKATKRGKVWWSEAMFPGYIFAKFSRSESERAVTYAHGVMCLVKFGTEVPVIQESFITELRESLEDLENEELIISPSMQVGDHVEVAYGAFEGETGQILEVLPALDRVKMLIELMGQDQVVDVDMFSLLLVKP